MRVTKSKKFKNLPIYWKAWVILRYFYIRLFVHKNFFRSHYEIVRNKRKRLQAKGRITSGTKWRRKRNAVIRRDGLKCRRCKKICKIGLDLTIDHIIPVTKGGTNNMKNLQVLCKECNGAKADKLSTY